MRFQIHDVLTRSFIPPIIRRDASLQQIQQAIPMTADAACVLLLGRLADGSSACVCIAQTVGVWVQLPEHFNEQLTSKLSGIRDCVRVEHHEVTPVMGYTMHRPTEDLSKPAKRPWARVVFSSYKSAKSFFNRRREYSRPGIRKDGAWDRDLIAAGLSTRECFDTPQSFSVHNLEDPDTTFFNDLNQHLGLVEDEDVASFGVWMEMDDKLVTKLDPRTMLTRYTHNFLARIEHIQSVERADVTPTALSYDLELYSNGGFPKRGDPTARITQCGIAFTGDDFATCECKVVCLRTHTKKLDPFLEPGTSDTTIVCVDEEQELLEAFGEALRTYVPLYLMGFNIVKFDNQRLWIRSLLFHLCHRRSFTAMKRYMDRLPTLLRKHRELCEALASKRMQYYNFYQSVSTLFGIDRDTPNFNPRIVPEVPRLLSLMEVNFTKSVYDYFSAGTDVKWIFYSGVLPTERLQLQTKDFETNADGNMVLDHFGDAFVMLDMWQYMKKNFKLPSNSLKNVCKFALSQDDPDNNKLDISYAKVHLSWHDEDAALLGKVAEYCGQDAILPIKLAFCGLIKAISKVGVFSQVQRASPRLVIMTGQGAKAVCQLLQICYQQAYVPNNPLFRQLIKIKGATVQEPVLGLYADPVVTIDFASLYPNTNIDENFSWDTLLEPCQIPPEGADIFETDVENPIGPDRHERVIRNFMGLLPRLQYTLLKRRAAAKKKMKAAKAAGNMRLYHFWNLRQMALKISANAWFGIVAAMVGYCAFPRVSALTTKMGREYIEKVRKHVVEIEKRLVPYGDTDSVLVRYKGCTVPEAFEQSEKLCHYITHTLFGDKPNTAIEVDYVYDGLFIMKKKKYVGVVVTDPTNTDPKERKLTFKGIDVVRRDTPFYIRDALDNIIRTMIPEEIGSDKSVEARRKPVTKQLKKLLNKIIDNQRGIVDYSYNKQMKDPSKYKNPERMAHVVLAQKMNQRIMSGEMKGLPKLGGDRIVFVKTANASSTTMFDCAEDPNYIKEHPEKGIELDFPYIIDRLHAQLKNYLQHYIPHYDKYFTLAKRCIGERTQRSRDMRAIMGGDAPIAKKHRWKLVKSMPSKRKRDTKQPANFSGDASIENIF
jgi:DNA polymerase elongation subunit (family B)